MNELLTAIKADLSDRRMRPMVAVVAVALIGAIGYAALGGGGEPAGSGAGSSGSASTGGAPSLATATATNPNAAKSEATFGTSYQHPAKLVDPFTVLKSKSSGTAKSSSATAKGATGKTSTTTTSSQTSSGSGGSATTPSTPTPKPKPATPKDTVSVGFGKVAAAGEATSLVSFNAIKIGEPVPSKANPLLKLKAAKLESRGKGGNAVPASATFSFSASNPPIVSGSGWCLPSVTQCEAVTLKVNQTEELQFLEVASGQTVAYQLKLLGVSAGASGK
ncbi:MAG: hypothetical protein ACYDA6_02655 [Solirubrobacteraceae bacterium]